MHKVINLVLTDLSSCGTMALYNRKDMTSHPLAFKTEEKFNK